MTSPKETILFCIFLLASSTVFASVDDMQHSHLRGIAPDEENPDRRAQVVAGIIEFCRESEDPFLVCVVQSVFSGGLLISFFSLLYVIACVGLFLPF